MDKAEFSYLRKILNKTQKQMAQLLGTSVKAVHSYEQGWRRVPPHVERHLLFLLSRVRRRAQGTTPCWDLKNCPEHRRRECPAWEFDAGRLCWFINGTICEGSVHENWEKKMEICRSCEALEFLLPDVAQHRTEDAR